MKIQFKTVQHSTNFLDDGALPIVKIDNQLISDRCKDYTYIKNIKNYYSNPEYRQNTLDDIFGSINILVFADNIEIGSISCFDLKNKNLFIDEIEIIDKGKGYGSLVFDELKKYFKTIKIEQAIPSAVPFYKKNGFKESGVYGCNKYPTMIWNL